MDCTVFDAVYSIYVVFDVFLTLFTMLIDILWGV